MPLGWSLARPNAEEHTEASAADAVEGTLIKQMLGMGPRGRGHPSDPSPSVPAVAAAWPCTAAGSTNSRPISGASSGRSSEVLGMIARTKFTLCGRRWVRGPAADRADPGARPRVDVVLEPRLRTRGLGPILIEGGNPVSAARSIVERDRPVRLMTSLGRMTHLAMHTSLRCVPVRI